jgi:hypothetical protein
MFNTRYNLHTLFIVETSGYDVITTFEMLVEATRTLTAHEKVLQQEIGYYVVGVKLEFHKISPQQQTPFIGKSTLVLSVFSQNNYLPPCSKSFFRS